MKQILRLMLPLVTLVVFIATSDQAHARRGFVLITHGETIKHAEDLPSEVKSALAQETGHEDIAVGYKYDHFGVFFCDIWSWGGEFCLYSDEDDTSYDATPTQLAGLLGKEERDLKKPFMYRFPVGLLIIGGIVVLVGATKIFGKSDEKKIKEMLNDPRYQKALEIMQERSKQQETAGTQEGQDAETPAVNTDDDGGFEAGVQYLTGQGISREKATKNLALLVGAIAAYSQHKESAG